MSDLLQYFESDNHRLIQKWLPYFEIYERHLARFRGTDVHIVEIGVYHGGSLQMWKEYFGVDAKIIGVDIDPRCKEFEDEGIEIIIGNQEDREFLRSLKDKVPRIDILLDDGGHTMNQQIVTFEELFPHISEDGVYICEDLHTNYWTEYGGGFRNSLTFIEYSKRLIDSLNAWHSRDPESFPVNSFTRSAYSMNFYISMLVIEKRAILPPSERISGQPSFDQDEMIRIMQVKQTGESLPYELHHTSGAEQDHYAELNSRFFKLNEEHQSLKQYVEGVQRFADQTQQEYQKLQQEAHQTHLKAQEFYSQAQQFYEQVQQVRHELVETQNYSQQELAEAQAHIEAVKVESRQQLEQQQMVAALEVEQLRTQLESAQLHTLQLQNDLLEVQRDQEVQRFRVERLSHKLEQVRGRVQRVKANLGSTQVELDDSRREIAAMKTSKFWKLRSKWVGIKQRLGLRQG